MPGQERRPKRDQAREEPTSEEDGGERRLDSNAKVTKIYIIIYSTFHLPRGEHKRRARLAVAAMVRKK